MYPCRARRRRPGRPATDCPRARAAGPILQEVGGSPEGRFWVEHQGNVLHIRVPSGDPARSVVEITTREQAFAPRQSGLGYIRIKGLTFQHAGNGFPPPQRGLVSTAGGHHWIIEGNTIEWANGVGLDIGAQHWRGAARSAGRRLARRARQHHPLRRRGRHRRHGHDQHARRGQPHRVGGLAGRRARAGKRRAPSSTAPATCCSGATSSAISGTRTRCGSTSATRTAGSRPTCSPTCSPSARPSTWR